MLLLAPWAVAQPRMVCTEPTYDFGERDEKDVVEHAFVLRNAGDEPLTISRVRPSCGCTVATLNTKTLGPGREARVEARFTLKGRRGAQRKSILVESNDPNTPRLHLSLTGNVVMEFGLQPDYVNFSRLTKDSRESQTVKLVSQHPGVIVKSVECDSKSFTAEIDPLHRDRIIVRTTPPLEPGTVRGTLLVRPDHPKGGELKAAVLGFVMGEVMVLPEQIVMPGEGGHTVRTILVRRGTVKEFKVLEVNVPSEEAKATFREAPKGTFRIEIRNLPMDASLDGKKIRIVTNLKEMHEILVPIHVQKISRM